MMTRAAFVSRLLAWFAWGVMGGILLGFTFSRSLYVLTLPSLVATRGAIAPQTGTGVHQFVSDAGIMLKFVHPDKTADFEATIDKLREALNRSHNPERRKQAQSWRVFKATELATNGDAVYVFEIDPAVPGADYTVARILAEAFPIEAGSLYQRYANASSPRQYIVDLKLIAAFGEQEPR